MNEQGGDLPVRGGYLLPSAEAGLNGCGNVIMHHPLPAEDIWSTFTKMPREILIWLPKSRGKVVIVAPILEIVN